MATSKTKSSIYLSSNLHEQVKALSRATQLPFNTHVVLALQAYVMQDSCAALIAGERSRDEREDSKTSSF